MDDLVLEHAGPVERPGVVARGLASATTLPVQAPTVGMKGRPIVRPLNHWWFFMISILVLPGGA